ncbi:MAG TPA: DNA repair protein RadA [Candidatus Hydrogenedentes bacterium]|nr:DNA repair protein RadA [Candidatus Hydrogenedentota bacterium]HOS02920.1 DNA repair protein RadA [Candidatus Hydrogenedentota bacterium]
MAKPKSRFVCQSCGVVLARWMGRCAECGEWNTIVEERIAEEGDHVRQTYRETAGPIPITDRAQQAPPRLLTGMSECDRVLGGGVVPGSLTLIGGDPGIGKSTLMLQVSHTLASTHGRTLYVSGEESFDQARLRASRLGALCDDLLILTETQVESVRKEILQNDYRFVVVDSIQSMYTAQLPAVPGSVGQVRECANEFLRIAKDTGVPVFLVGHVTKDGAIAGPRLLEHLVDTVLYFEGEGKQALRILRAVKNRFGSTNEIGVFEMTEAGLKEVPNPSALFLNERPKGVSGSIVIPSVEGTRPLLVEVQALVGDAMMGTPRRTVTGMNPNRVSLILAVLEKRAGAHVSDRDVFVNVAGGVRLDEPATDLAVALAVMSSLLEVPLPPGLAAFGEIGLAGEIRAVDLARQRVAEAKKFGFASCVLPRGCMSDLDGDAMHLLPAAGITQAIEWAMER